MSRGSDPRVPVAMAVIVTVGVVLGLAVVFGVAQLLSQIASLS